MVSKRILSLSILVLYCAVSTSLVQAEVVIPPEMLGGIEALTALSFNLYPLDQAQGEAVFARIDGWAGEQMALNDAVQINSRKSSRVTWVTEASQNKPIFAGDAKEEAPMASKPVRMKYVKKLQGRAFVKALRRPRPKGMDKEQVAGLARQFIGQHGFAWETNRDKMGSHLVVNWVCRTEKVPGKKKASKLVVLQRVLLKRALDGMEVLNSRQIVDIHPRSGEILAFKHLNWVPADEANSKAVQTLRGNEVLAAIQQALRPTNTPYRVTDVKAGLYQGDDSIFPVLAVRVERAAENQPDEPLRKVLLVPLAKAANPPEREEPREWPQFARH